jgi:Holliday junction DNA helicase RuvB
MVTSAEVRPKSDINDAPLGSLAEVIGQRSVVAQVTTALAAARADRRRFDHGLLVGGPGLGKTTVAQLVAREMGAPFHEVLGQSLAANADLNALLLSAGDHAVVLIDECHEIPKPLQTALLLALDQRRILLPGGKSAPRSIGLSDFTLLLATTDEYSLVQPLRDRMKLVLRFGYFSRDELVEVARQRAEALGWPVTEAVLPEIACRSRGTPRLALRLLQACRRVCRAEGAEEITPDYLRRACELEELDGLGLGPNEQSYLAVLAEGPVRLNVVASRLGLPGRTVAEVIEPYLIRSGLVVKDDAGRRVLTDQGQAAAAASTA